MKNYVSVENSNTPEQTWASSPVHCLLLSTCKMNWILNSSFFLYLATTKLMFPIVSHPCHMIPLWAKTGFSLKALQTEAGWLDINREKHHKCSCTDNLVPDVWAAQGAHQNTQCHQTLKIQKILWAQCRRIQCLEVFSAGCPLIQSAPTITFSFISIEMLLIKYLVAHTM